MNSHIINWSNNIPLDQENILLIFSKTWCPPCKALVPELNKLDNLLAQNNINCKICKIDCEEFPAIAQTYGIRSVPTILFNKKGHTIPYNSGRDSGSMLNWIKSNI
jgi:thioredoxin 1